MDKVLNVRYIMRNTPKPKELSVAIRKHKLKRVGLFATKPIKKNQVIAYYRISVYSLKNFKSATGEMYTFAVYTAKGNVKRNVIGDLSKESLVPPCDKISYWAYFSNEPSIGEEGNAFIDLNLKENYKNRKVIKAGDTVVYKLRALRNIKRGEEIMWCYGEDYDRNYQTPCDD